MRQISTYLLRFWAALLLGALLLALPAAAAPATSLYFRGSQFSAQPGVCLVDGVTYVPLRAFSEQADSSAVLDWNKETKTATLSGDGLALQVSVGSSYLVANGRYLYCGGSCFTRDGGLMVPIRPLAEAFGFSVVWDGRKREVRVEGELKPIESGESYYDEDNLYWLSRIISAEARGESLEGQIAVGNVVLNRMANDYWPDDVYGVVFDDRYGVQFSPTANGTIYDEPAESAVIAAKLALDGANTAGNSLFFLNEAIATSKWIVESCEFVKTIGNHSFYTKDV